MKSNAGQKILQLFLYVFAILGIAVVIYNGLSSVWTDRLTITASAQQDPFLSQRINQIEQRFSSIETRINRLEQESRLPNLTRGAIGNNDAEIRLLQSQIDTLRLRGIEAECGLVKLDERTLSNAVRQGRKKTGSGQIDKCRLDSGEPLQMSAVP
jgi:hypothetical protein